jgi:exopolysaccharide biosynthesis polyprenyl glycosylphosphotransferase
MFIERGLFASPRRFALLLVDAVCVSASIVLSSTLRLAPKEGWAYVLEHIPSLGGSALIFLVVFYAAGMYEMQTLSRKRDVVWTCLISTSIGLLIIITIFYARFHLNIGRGILFLAGLFIFISALVVRQLYRTAIGYGLLSKNSLIIGEGSEIKEALQLIAQTSDSGYRVYGVVSTTLKPGEFVDGVPVLGGLNRLRELVDLYSIGTIIVATSLVREHALLRLLRPLRYSGVDVLDGVALHEELAHEIPLDYIDDEWLMNAAMNSSVVPIRKIKRVMDITVSIVGLVLSCPLLLITALLVRLDSPGPIIFRQRRSGLDGYIYTLLKFRTMRQDAEALSGAIWAEKQDTRVTRVGRFLRKWRLDEIPQLINVLKGEMSLVGPRPERPEFVDTLAEAIPFYKERLLVPPGITGWAQIKYPYAASIDAARRKLQYDLYYIKRMSLIMDSLILLRTFRTIVLGLRHSEGADQQDKAGSKLLKMNTLQQAGSPSDSPENTKAG